MSQQKNRIILYIIIGLTALLAVGGKLVFGGMNQAQSPAELLNLGEQYLLDLDYENALVQFLKVIEIEPMNERAYTGAVEAYIGLGQTEEAVAVLEDGFAVLPDNAALQARLLELRIAVEERQQLSTEPVTEIVTEATTEAPSEPEEIEGLLQTGYVYYLRNPGLSGYLRFDSDDTFEMYWGMADAIGVYGDYTIASPDTYLMLTTAEGFYATNQLGETYKAVVEGDSITVTRGSDGFELIFYIPSDDIVQPEVLEENEVTATTTEFLELRKGPGLEHEATIGVEIFRPLRILGYNADSKEWVCVEYGDYDNHDGNPDYSDNLTSVITGWVAAEYLDGLPLSYQIANAQGKYVIDATYLDMVGRSYADITYRLGSVESEFMFHGEYYVTSPDSGVLYRFSGDNMNRIAMGFSPEMNDHDVCVKVDAQLGVIVGGFTEQMTLEEFVANLESAIEYEMLESAGTSYYVAAEDYAVVHLDNGHYLHINMDRAGGMVSPDSYVWLI